MTNYVQTTFFTPKDTLPVTDPNKTIFGAAYDVEFGNLATAIASKYDTTSTPTFAGAVTAPAFIPNGASVPINGMYLSAAHTVSFAANGVFEGSFNGGMVLGAPTGSFKGVGTLNATALYINGTILPSITGYATPTGLATLAAAAGVATTIIRSDANIAIDQTISPTWTGAHLFQSTLTANQTAGLVTINSTTATNAAVLFCNLGGVNKARFGSEGTAGNTVTGSSVGDMFIYTAASTNILFSIAGAAAALKIGSGGNVTIAAPSGGTTVAINGIAAGGGTGLDINAEFLILGTNAALSANGGQMRFRKDTGASAWAIGLPASAAATTFFIYDLVNGREAMNIAAGGNVTIDAPASGIALTVSPFAGAITATIGQLQIRDNGFAGSDASLIATSTNALDFGTSAAASSSWYTNNTQRVTINSTGNVTINAPSSAKALVVNGASSDYAIQALGNSASGNSFGISILAGTTSADAALAVGNQANSATFLKIFGDGHGTLGATVTAGIQWTTAGVTTINSSSGTPLTIQANGTSIFAALGTTSPTIQGYGPTAAGLVDMTPDKGTFTITYTGFTANPTGTAVWARNGNIVTLMLPAATATSNATTMTATGLPAAIQPARAMTIVLGAALVEDNNFASVANCGASLAASSGTITFTYNPVNGTFGGGGFTASGTKGISVSTPITYILN